MSAPEFSGLFVSVSQVKTYLLCPRQYELRYVRGVRPAFVPLSLAFGGAFHAALAYAYGMLKLVGDVPSTSSVVGVFLDAWTNAASGPIPLMAEEDEKIEAQVDKGRQMLGVFLEYLRGTMPVSVHGVEMPFQVDLHDADTGEVLEEKLAGVIDLVVQEGERQIVVEHKTAARKYSDDQLRYDLQPTTYAHAARELGLGEVGLRYQVITKTRAPAVQIADVTRTCEDQADFLRTVVGVLRAIEARAFWPQRGWQCRSCPYSEPCRRRSS